MWFEKKYALQTSVELHGLEEFYFCPLQKVNPLHCDVKFFRVNENIYSHFMSFLHIDMTQIVEIFPQVRQELT